MEPEPAGGPPQVARGEGRGSRMLGDRKVLVSTVSTIVFFGLVTVAVLLAPGSKEVANDFFNWEAMKEAFTGTPETPIGVWEGFLLNVKMFLVAEAFILVIALVIAVIRQTPGPVLFPLRLVATAYTDLFRGIPLILVIYIFGFGIPGLELEFISGQSVTVLGVIALILSYSAYVAEVYRAGIQSVHTSQVAAARSLGLSRWQAMRFVVLPQAVRRVIPPLLNDFISLQKDTALVSVLGPIEAARAAQIYGTTNFNYSSFVVAAFLFIMLTIPLARFTDHLVERDRRRRESGGAL